ncbi:MAG: DUF6092 family protein [Candidatus Bathyarchaeia archaeon]
MSVEKKSGDEYLFEIGAFLISSAKGLLQEPKLYGPVRLLTAFSKIAVLPEYASCLKRDEFLIQLKNEIEEIIPLVMSDPEAFEKSVKDLSIKLAREIKNRRLRQKINYR